MNGTFTPAPGKLLVKRTAKKDKSGGVILPGNSMEIPHDGVIIALPKYATAESSRAAWAAGQHVFYSAHTDEEIVIDDESFFLVRFEHIHGVLNRENI